MNGEIPSVPITTLAGVASLTNLLPQLPLPSPLAYTMNNKSLLYHPKVAEEARRILANRDDGLVMQLAQSLRQSSTEHIELKDNMAGDSIEGELPDLLKAILAKDPDVFKKGSCKKSQEHAGVNSRAGNGQPFTQHNQHPSPYQAGQVSPCPPGSPARLPHHAGSPNQIGGPGSSFNQFSQGTNAVQHASTRQSSKQASSAASKFQQQFLSFAAGAGGDASGSKDVPTINGGLSGNGPNISPPHTHSRRSRSATVTSPVQASAAPVESSRRHHSNHNKHSRDHYRNDDGDHARRRSSSRSGEPVVLLEPLSNEPTTNAKCKGRLTRSKKTVKAQEIEENEPANKQVKIDVQQHCVIYDKKKTRGLRKSKSELKMTKASGLDSKKLETDHTQKDMVKENYCKPDNMLAKPKKEGLRKKVDVSKPKSDPEEIRPILQEIDTINIELDMETDSSSHNLNVQMPMMAMPTVKLTRIESIPQSELDAKIKKRMASAGSERLSMKDRKGRKRHRSGSEEEWAETNSHDRSSRGSERSKRRRRVNAIVDDSDSDVQVMDDGDDDYREDTPPPEVRKKKDRRHKLKRMGDLANMTNEELMETNTFKKFGSAIDTVLESAEDIDIASLVAEEDDVGASSDAIIPKYVLQELANEAAKLKAMGVMNQVPQEKLTKLLAIMQLNIKDGCRALPQGEDGHDDDHLYREISLEKVTTAVDAALTAMYIMTSHDMPKEVYIEDVIDRICLMTKVQLHNTIYPEFDPVYRTDPSSKGGYQQNSKRKRASAAGKQHKSTLTLYNKLTELIAGLSELIDIQELTDTIILQTSTLAVSPFFVENISELQLNSLKLVTSIFTRYEKHRQLILEDILSSLARLPTSKKNIRNYRLNSDENIQMVTALALELIQCVTRLPAPPEPEDQHRPASPAGKDKDKDKDKHKDQNNTNRSQRSKKELMDDEVVIVTSYETSMRTAHNFLAVFLRKCAQKGEEDYRPLFENFVYDLLATVNKPEWPAAEMILSLLGRLLVQQFSNKSVDMSMRVASLDYLGIVAARLRKDAVSSKLNEETIDEILQQIFESDNEEEQTESRSTRGKPNKAPANETPKLDRTQNLQKALLEYLTFNAQNDPALLFARRFYITQWYRDCSIETEKLEKKMKSAEKKIDDDEELAQEMERFQSVIQECHGRKEFLLSHTTKQMGAFASYKPSPSKMDYDNALLVTRYLASNRPFSQSFDIYLTQILKVLCETAVAVRTKAMKCLTAVVESDPGILARSDMQKGVHGRFLDHSTSVREAAVELVGKFILIRPELTSQYYDMLSARILDTGISVRKRVIKIFRDVCLEQPDFEKIPEMCVKMIRRVNDEEGIKKLVTETFQSMWFTPVRDKYADTLLTKANNITDVVTTCKETGLDWFEQLLENLLKKEEDANNKPVEKACHQLVTCLVENVLRIEEDTGSEIQASARLLSCLTTLYLFCKTKPALLVPHTQTIQPYLNIKCNSQADLQVLHNVARILELSVPLMEHPSESFLAQLEEDMMKLILKHGMMVLVSCVSCLGSIVNNVTKNYKLVRDCFGKFFGVLSKLMQEHKNDPASENLVKSRPTLLRSLFTVGLLCKHFDFDSEDFGEKRVSDSWVSIRDRVFDVLMYFIHHEEEDVRHKALTGLGFYCTRHFEYMLGKNMRDIYHGLLNCPDSSLRMRCQVLRNLQTYLTEEELKMIRADEEWKKNQQKEDLKEMNDIQSGMSSTVIQVYLKQVLESFLNSHMQVRMAALSVITLIMRQGLVHPVQCVPYLICMGTDSDAQIRIKADQQLQEIDKKYPGFIQMKAMQGLKMSYKLQELLEADPSEPIRGMRVEENSTVAVNHFLYSTIRGNRNQRRAMVSSILNMFDETAKAPMTELVYMADNLAFFPYVHQDEALYIIHQVDILVSVSGSNLLQSFQELFHPPQDGEERKKFFYPGSTEEGARRRIDDDEDEDVEQLLERVPEDPSQLYDLFMVSQGCVLLLILKQHLKELYGFTDSKIHLYTPIEGAKQFDKPLNRRHGHKFEPTQVLELIRNPIPRELDDNGKRQLIESYLDFKDLMLSIDPDQDDDDDDVRAASGRATPAAGASGAPTTPATAAPGSEGTDPNAATTEGGQAPQPTENSAAGTVDNPVTPVANRERSSRPSTPGSIRSHHHSSHRHSSSSHRRNRSSHTPSSSRKSRESSSHSKPHKHKKKKKKRRLSDSDEEDDDDSDPDWE